MRPLDHPKLGDVWGNGEHVVAVDRVRRWVVTSPEAWVWPAQPVERDYDVHPVEGVE